MSYTPRHLEWLDRQSDFGWPDWMDNDARGWLTDKVREVLIKYGPMRLQRLYELATDKDLWPDAPECVRGAKLWDVLLGITHRAALAANAEELWHLPPHHWRDRLPARHNDDALRTLLDPYRSDLLRCWQPVGTHDNGLLFDDGAIVVRLHAESGRWRCYKAGSALRDKRGAIRSWAKPSAACKAGLALLAEQTAGKLGVAA